MSVTHHWLHCLFAIEVCFEVTDNATWSLWWQSLPLCIRLDLVRISIPFWSLSSLHLWRIIDRHSDLMARFLLASISIYRARSLKSLSHIFACRVPVNTILSQFTHLKAVTGLVTALILLCLKWSIFFAAILRACLQCRSIFLSRVASNIGKVVVVTTVIVVLSRCESHGPSAILHLRDLAVRQ